MTEDPTALRRPEETPTVVVPEAARRAIQFTPGHILGGRYRIVSLIGRGGMGEVYRADDLKIGHTVALKFLSHREHAQRLYEEVRIGREISHPNVCRLYDAAEVDDQLFITMEFIDGEDLASLLRRVGRLSSEKALDVSRDICAGLAAAHDKRVIHRDLKPANVMIDGRGRARVTDFGLAVAGERAADNAGTLAYMAPEQLRGAPASIASDIYALGLVLYEIFTGKRPFAAASTRDLVSKQQSAEYTRPSSITREVPAAIERVIVRCLDPEPQARPASVEQVLRELPGGDPLAAAVAAGETPSPEMVAAATKSGELSAPLAWALFAVSVAGFVGSALVSPRTLLHEVTEMKAPEVLQERARQVLADAGVTARPADSELFIAEAYPRLTAVYRYSRRAMRARNPNGTLQRFDPPLGQAMANVEVDADGRLQRFLIVPPNVDTATAHAGVNWEPFLRAAGYDAPSLTTAMPVWAAAIVDARGESFVDSDSKSAWLTKDGHRVEAASYHGRPVFFSVITPELAQLATAKARPPFLPEQLAFAMLLFFLIVIPIAAIALARINLRRRRGDRAGALRVALFCQTAVFIGLTFRAHHPMNFVDEWRLTSWHTAQATFSALIIALMYLALEPIVRRRWPQILISWTRLLSGKITDPMIGRDVLLGAAASAVVIGTWQMTRIVSGNIFFDNVAALGPARFVVSTVADTLAEALLRGLGLVILFVLLRAVIRQDNWAAVATALMIAVMTLGDTTGPPALRAYYALIASFTGVILARQLGMLAVMSYVFFVLIQQRVPLTFDTDAWYFARSAIVIAFLIAIAAAAFRISVGGKRWLPRVALE
jgi:serine/threonine-protein kinase